MDLDRADREREGAKRGERKWMKEDGHSQRSGEMNKQTDVASRARVSSHACMSYFENRPVEPTLNDEPKKNENELKGRGG